MQVLFCLEKVVKTRPDWRLGQRFSILYAFFNGFPCSLCRVTWIDFHSAPCSLFSKKSCCPKNSHKSRKKGIRAAVAETKRRKSTFITWLSSSSKHVRCVHVQNNMYVMYAEVVALLLTMHEWCKFFLEKDGWKKTITVLRTMITYFLFLLFTTFLNISVF